MIALASLLIGTYFSVDQIRKRKRDRRASELKPDYELLDNVAVLLDNLESLPVTKADIKSLDEQCSRIKQAEKRWPKIAFGTIVANLIKYETTVLPDDFAKKLTRKKASLEELLTLSRQQGAALAGVRTAIDAVQRDIEQRSTR
ncbi:hypothetical protein ACQEVY_00785 [Streptomyces sp. CA-288835]|uniref:hypothetical protein n=1 Tax=Streptomyces sp. CA-288835 TaxID=3240069 RepID=UPI003D90231E